MDVFEAIQERRSIRSYTDQPVEREKMEKIVEAGRLAPSAKNCEPWHFITVTDLQNGKLCPEAHVPKFLTQSPLVIVACGDKKASPDWYAIDVALAVENMVLTAVSLGLGTCCVGSFSEKDIKAAPENPREIRSPRHVSRRLPKRQNRSIKQTPKHCAYQKITQRSRKRRRIRQTICAQENRRTLNKRPLLLARN